MQKHKLSPLALVLIIVVLALGSLYFFFGTGKSQDEAANAPVITSIEELNDSSHTVGSITGMSCMFAVEENLPKATIANMNDALSGYLSVQEGKLDAFVYDRVQMNLAIIHGQKGVRILDENLGQDYEIAAGLSPVSKIPDLENKINQFIAECRANGTLQEMYDRWASGREEMPDLPPVQNPGLKLVIGTSGTVAPYSYYKGNELYGSDIEFGRRFAAWLGAECEFKVYDYGAIVPAALTGDVDIIVANLNVTPERKEKMHFSDTLCYMQNGVMVRDPSATGTGGSFFDSLANSFESTFIKEDRWKLFVDGIGMTMFITVAASVLGTVLGFVGFLGCRKGNPIANKLADFLIWLVQGMPTVVLLMVLYYIVFAESHLASEWVAVIAFTLTFGASVFSILRMGVGAVDSGQVEASHALGFSDSATFFKVVLPQAAPHIFPSYKTAIVSLIKATAIVGYIAVQDLTKVGDIIRSRTYEAFFPLIAVAILYFVLAGILTTIVRRIQISWDPRTRSREDILRGIDVHDRD